MCAIVPMAAIRGDQNREDSCVGSGLSELGLARLGWSLILAVTVLLDVLLKLRTEGLKKEEADKSGSSDLAGTSAEDLGDCVDDHHEGDEGEDDDEHDDSAKGFHCSDCLSVFNKAYNPC